MDSAPPFVVFRPRRSTTEEAYQIALQLTSLVADIVDRSGARFHLKDRLDRLITSIALHVGQAVTDPVPAARRQQLRRARALGTDAHTLLDILAARDDEERRLVSPALAHLVRLRSVLDGLGGP